MVFFQKESFHRKHVKATVHDHSIPLVQLSGEILEISELLKSYL